MVEQTISTMTVRLLSNRHPKTLKTNATNRCYSRAVKGLPCSAAPMRVVNGGES